MNKYTLNGNKTFVPGNDCLRSTIHQARYVLATNSASNQKYIHVLSPGTRIGFLRANNISAANTGPDGKTVITVGGEFHNPLTTSHYATSTYAGHYYYKNTWIITGEKNGCNFYETDGPLCCFFEKDLILNNKKGNWIIASKLDHNVFGQQRIPTNLIHWYANVNDKQPADNTSFTAGDAVLETGHTYVWNNANAVIGTADLSTDGNRALFVRGLGHNQLMYQTQIKTSLGIDGIVDAAQYQSNPKDNYGDLTNPRTYHLKRFGRWTDMALSIYNWMWFYERSPYQLGFASAETLGWIGANFDDRDDAVCPTNNWYSGPNNSMGSLTLSINDRVNTLNTLVPEPGMRIFCDNIHPTTNFDIMVESVGGAGNKEITLNQDCLSLLSGINNIRLSFDFNIPNTGRSVCILPGENLTITKEPYEELIVTDGPSLASGFSDLDAGATSPVNLMKVNKAETFI